MTRAYFGAPRNAPSAGGMQVTVYVVPVYQSDLVVFEVHVKQARGRWLPWDVIDFGANPYEAASELVDDWCDGALSDLSLVDVLSLEAFGEGWELAIIFRAELTAMPAGEATRNAIRVSAGALDAIGAFDPVDLERWLRHGTHRAVEGPIIGASEDPLAKQIMPVAPVAPAVADPLSAAPAASNPPPQPSPEPTPPAPASPPAEDPPPTPGPLVF